MSDNLEDVRQGLEAVSFGDGVTRDRIREQWPGMPQEIFLLLPASKPFLSAEQVLTEVSRAGARAQGEFATADLDLPTDGAEEDQGPPAWGGSLTATDHLVEGHGDYPGSADDLGGNSLETGSGRGTQPE